MLFKKSFLTFRNQQFARKKYLQKRNELMSRNDNINEGKIYFSRMILNEEGQQNKLHYIMILKIELEKCPRRKVRIQ